MEKHKNNNGGKPPKKQPKQSVFGANTFHLSDETSSKLIGGIVEKGIISDNFTTPSSTSSFPLTSPLPFPLARHRSHGPHWTPVGQLVTSGGGGDDDGNCDEENDPTSYDLLANFANAIETKMKKGLDFNRWKEVVRSSDIDSNIQPKDNTMSMTNGVKQQKTCDPVLRNFDNKCLVDEQSMDIDNSTSDLRESQLKRSPYNEVDMGFEDFSSTDMVSVWDKNPSSTVESSCVSYEQGDTGLESQIDAENRALIQKMSPEEIAEAQTELRNRLNPELLNLLKKRGINKLEKKGSSGLSSTDTNLLGDKQADGIAGGNEVSVRGSTPRLATQSQTMPILQTKLDEGVQDPVSKSSGVWSSWSKRVEAVRNLRFSLDGNVIEGSSLSPTYSADNVAERDFLRTEGDPAASGYTVKEALALARSVVPGQRTLSWHLLETIFSKALQGICRSQLHCMTKVSREINIIDWEALWAYVLGPEPELALSLRLAIDDNHTSVTLASAKVIRCILSCDLNEKFFNSTMKLARMDLYTAPVFRCRPDIKHGFFGGGFWKYSTKPSNILSPDEEVMNDKNEGERTIQDDNVVAGQDVAAGLVRMESLHRFRYLLETEPSAALEECILSILIAVARHSPTCANAIWKFERLVQTIVDRFKRNDTGAKVKSVTLLRVLAQSSKIICMDFIDKGFFQVMTWQLYRVTPSIDEWLKFGSEKSTLPSQLMVEQLRFWKVCITYGYCISSFTGFFPALCVFLSPPTFDKLIGTNVLNEFASITTEAYLVLKSLADTLSDPYSSNIRSQQFSGTSGTNVETWCWNDACPMVNSALQWLEVSYDTTLLTFFDQLIGVDNKSIDRNTSTSSFLWSLSAVMHFLHTVLLKATPADILVQKGCSTKERTIPEFVSKLALQIINNGIFDFSDKNKGLYRMSDLVDKLCYVRHKPDPEASVAAVWCLNTLVRLVLSTDHLVYQTQGKVGYKLFEGVESSRGRKILHDGIFKSSLPKWEKLVDEFMNIVTSEWHHICQIEVFGRGGPAPGVGVGWGASGGGFWGVNVVAFQADARLLIELLGPWLSSGPMDLPDEENKFMVKIVNSALALSLMVGPRDKITLQKIFGILLELPVLKSLNQHILRFLRCSLGKESLEWENKEDDLLQFSKILASHFTDRWLDEKKKKEKNPEMKAGPHFKSKSVNIVGNSLGTIPEEEETSNVMIREDTSSLMVEWAHQRMPLPSYWLLSPITIISSFTEPSMQNTEEFLQVAKAGLFLLLGIEAMTSCLPSEDKSLVRSIPLIWRLHSLSVPLLAGKGVLEEEKSRDMFEALQSLYGQHLDELQLSSINDGGCLRFQTEIHENYSTFLEALVEQFAAVSYGDLIYGRQIGIYLHRQVESSVRLAAWNTLSNARVLELLPPLDKCVSRPEGYLEPVEDDAAILEAYAKSWVSGALDRSVRRGSVSYTIALHHLSTFIFSRSGGEKSLLRNKIVKSILRDYSRKRQHEGMMLDLIKYNGPTTILKSEEYITTLSLESSTGPRLEVLKEACEGNSQLLKVVDELKSSTQTW